MYERSWTILNDGAAASVFVIPLSLPDGSSGMEIEAWQSSNSILPAVLFQEGVALADAQNRMVNSGPLDALMAIPNSGVGKVRFDPTMHSVTVFFPFGDTGGAQVVTIRAREC